MDWQDAAWAQLEARERAQLARELGREATDLEYAVWGFGQLRKKLGDKAFIVQMKRSGMLRSVWPHLTDEQKQYWGRVFFSSDSE